MPHPSTLAVGSLSQVSAATPSALAASGSAPHVAPDILTYCYASRMVYVTPGESYDVRPCPHNVSFPFFADRLYASQHAVEIAKESFIELKDIECERIALEVHVVLKNQQFHRTAEIGRTAWPVVVASLERFEIVEIRVASELLKVPAMIPSRSQSSSSELPPYASEKGWNSDYSQTNLVPYRSQMSSSQSSSPSLATRVVDLLSLKSSRGRFSPQPHQL